jgi:hypothetical protein
VPLTDSVTNFTGVSFSTGPARPVIDRATSSVTNDVPLKLTTYTIQRLTIR